jgi:hypothetical protein
MTRRPDSQVSDTDSPDHSSVTLLVPYDPKALDIQFNADGAGPVAGHSSVG